MKVAVDSYNLGEGGAREIIFADLKRGNVWLPYGISFVSVGERPKSY